MKDPTKVKTPEATGATEIVKPTPNEDTAFSQFDYMDIQAIGASQVGKPVDRMVYQWGNASKSGKKECEFADGTPVPDNVLQRYPCKYSGKTPHTHITGVGWFGIRFIKSKLWGISSTNSRPEPLRKSGVMYYECTAWASDKLTGNDSMVIMLLPQSKVAHMPIQHQFITAQTFAKRNAISELFDPTAMQGIENIIREGRETINEDDIVRVFGPMLIERKALQQIHMKAIAQGHQLEVPSRMLPPAAMSAPRGPEALPGGQDGGNAESGDSGGFPGSSKQKYSLASKIQKGAGCTKDQALEFIAAKMTTYETMQDYFAAFNDGNFDDVSAWLEQQGGENDQENPK